MRRAMSRISSRASLGLPDRDYYLKDDAHFNAIRAAYREHIVKLLSLAGEDGAEAAADGIIALETTIARLQWTRVENRDPIKTYNKREMSALPALVTADDWPAYLSAAGVGADIRTLIVAQPSYFGRRRDPARGAALDLAGLPRLQSASAPMRLICRSPLLPRISPSSSTGCAACRKTSRAGSAASRPSTA